MKNFNEELIENFKTHLIEEEKSAVTIEKYVRDVKAFEIWLGGRSLEKGEVIKYKEHLVSEYAPASVNSILSSLNSFFSYCGWYGFKVKTLKIQKQLFLRSEKELSKDEYKRLLFAAKQKGNEKLYFLMQTICSTGIRVSELKFITVESLASRKAYINLKGKMRMVILSSELCKALKNYIGKQKITSGPIFVTKNGKPLDRSNIWKLMKSLCESAGVIKEKVFPHNLRHLFARTYYSVQKDIVRLADILGHTSVDTTRIYTMETGEIHRMQIEKMGLLIC